MLRPDFKITFGDMFSPIYSEEEIFFSRYTDLEKVALSAKQTIEQTLVDLKRYFIQEIAERMKTIVVSSFLSNKDHLISCMLNDVAFFKEYSGRKFTFKTNEEYLIAIKRELTEERVFRNLIRLIDPNSIKIKDSETMDITIIDFIEESVKTLSEINNTKESTAFEFPVYYDLDNFLSHNGRMTSSFPNYLKDCGVVDNFLDTVKGQIFSIIIFIFKNSNTLFLR